MTRITHVFGAMAALAILPLAAAAQEACTAYTVAPGDSLSGIAQSAYGTFDYQTIFNANRNLITNPNSLETGIVLQLPCADGSLPNAAPAQQIIAEQEAAAGEARSGVSALYEPPIRIVSGNGWEPFVGERFNGGGMLMRLATTSLKRAGNNREYTVSFVDDWASHFDTLLPMGAFDISVAWYIPDCTKYELLSRGMKQRCDADHSLPVYEAVAGFYSLPGNEYQSVRTYAELAGARICRPEGFFTYDLEEQGMVPPIVTMVHPKTIEDCFDLLMDGEVDILSLEIVSVAGAAAELGLADKIVENPYLTSILSMSFVTHKTNPRGKVYLAMINRGLTEMRESGEWYAIISDSLAEFERVTSN